MHTELILAGVAQWQSSGFVNRRLEVQFLSPAPDFSIIYLLKLLSPTGATSFDQGACTLLFRGDPFHLKQPVKAICELLPKAERDPTIGI
jgi:hypothetical protein